MSDAAAPPFSAWEREIAARYLRARRSEGGVALISIISFAGIALAVAVLIIVMSVMNGFRAELLNKILGFNGHIFVTGGLLDNAAMRDDALAKIKRIDAKVPVILTSGYDESETARKYTGLNPQGFLQKPYTADRLVEAVATVMERLEK